MTTIVKCIESRSGVVENHLYKVLEENEKLFVINNEWSNSVSLYKIFFIPWETDSIKWALNNLRVGMWLKVKDLSGFHRVVMIDTSDCCDSHFKHALLNDGRNAASWTDNDSIEKIYYYDPNKTKRETIKIGNLIYDKVEIEEKLKFIKPVEE